MVKRKFFAHKGSDGRDYKERAGHAENRTRNQKTYPRGEVLYSGSIIPHEVHDAWWRSEDNRPKLYASHLNRNGIGIINKTWTVVVGSAYDRRSNRNIVR